MIPSDFVVSLDNLSEIGSLLQSYIYFSFLRSLNPELVIKFSKRYV